MPLDIHTNDSKLLIENFISGRRGRITKATTANFSVCMNSSLLILSLYSSNLSLSEIIIIIDIAKIIDIFNRLNQTKTQIKKVRIAVNSLVIQISHFLNEA